MKNLSSLIALSAIAVQCTGQAQTLPIDVSQYKPMALPQVTASDSASGAGNLIRYDLRTQIFDTSYVKPAEPDAIIIRPPSRGIAEAELMRNSMKVSGFSALQPADQIPGFPSYPFSTIVKLFITFSGQQQMTTCSGAMINKDFVITAGHCVFNTQNGQWASQITVVPAYNMSTSPYGYTQGIRWLAFDGYAKGHDWNYDVAVVQTATPIGNTTGWLGWGSNMDNASFTNAANIHSSIGYPAQDDNGNPVFENGERMYAWNGYLDYWEGPNTVCHYNQGFHGQSGSALYYKNVAQNERYVYGVLSHGSPNPYHTCHCRMDNTMANTIAGLMPPETAGTSVANNLEIITYPSPAANTVTVDFGSNVFQTGIVEIWSLCGALVKRAPVTNEKLIKIDLSDVPNGTYLLSASLDGKRYSGKIIKVE